MNREEVVSLIHKIIIHKRLAIGEYGVSEYRRFS